MSNYFIDYFFTLAKDESKSSLISEEYLDLDNSNNTDIVDSIEKLDQALSKLRFPTILIDQYPSQVRFVYRYYDYSIYK